MSRDVPEDSNGVNDPNAHVAFPEVGIMAMVPERWSGNWQTRHQIMTRLSRFFKVIWINPQASWREIAVSVQGDKVDASRRLSDSFTVYPPGRGVPLFYAPEFLNHYTTKFYLQRARKNLIKQGCKKIILYLWRPEFLSALDLVEHDLSCYHIDDEYTFSQTEQPIPEEESILITSVDQVIIHSRALLEKKGHLNPNTVLVPNGVNYQYFSGSHVEPTDLASIPHPRITYVGVIKSELDMALMYELAGAETDKSFIFVGYKKNNLHGDGDLITKLFELPNVYWLGPKDTEMLPAYMMYSDVCSMCYKKNDYTKYIYPLKLHEYFASGRPIVSTPLNAMREFSEHIIFADNLSEWRQGIEEAMGTIMNSPRRCAQRKEVAKQHDWMRHTEKIVACLCARLDFADSKIQHIISINRETP